MKRRILRFYDKMIIAAILAILGFFGCCRKTYPEKKATEKTVQAKDSLQGLDTTDIKNKFDRRVIALYGVRPAQK